MQTHFELSMTYTELYALYRDTGCSYICWSLQDALSDRFSSTVPDDYDPSWVVNEDVAGILYDKYREFVPKQDEWEISECPTLPCNQMLIQQFGIMSLFSPHEVNQTLGDVIAVDDVMDNAIPIDGDWSDGEKFKVFFDDGLAPSHVKNFRTHILGVIASNDPNGVITVTCDI